jgi:hypothetical protein
MKTSLATTISVVGVLAAGGIALAVNSSVLDSATMTAENAPALQAEILPLADTSNLVPTGAVGTISAQGNGVESPSPSAPSTPSTLVSGMQPTETTTAPSTQSAYNVQGFGVVTLSQGASSLTVVSVVPESTVKYTTKQESPTRIEVAFVSNAGVRVKFHADIIDGRVVTSVMNEGGPRDSARSKGSDDHDDDHEDDDHDKEHDDDHESGEHDDD